MADFDKVRQELRAARGVRDQTAQAMAATRERLKRIERKAAELARVFDERSPEHRERATRLREERDSAQGDAKLQRELHAFALDREGRLAVDFAAFTDPLTGIERLDDSTPILLMPVRLETRFKGKQLWVRIFPDDCWVDTFDPILTDGEVAAARTYWTSLWSAGGFEGGERAAWVALATSFGSGRAGWILEQYVPMNPSDKPAKPRPEDVILVIATEVPLAAAERGPVADYFSAAWRSEGDAVKTDAALVALRAALGPPRAAEILNDYVPTNFAATPAAGMTRSDVNLSLAFLTLPVVGTKQSAWSEAPKAVGLPDRFVFLGYETADDETPLVAIGEPVPSPLIVGPNPSAAAAQQYQRDADGDLVVPDELKWLSDFERAVQVGMGLRIDLTENQAKSGFERVLVIGLRLSSDATEAQAELETLLQHHSVGRAGLALVPQGTPTNNTEGMNSGGSRLDDPNSSFDERKQPLFTPQASWLDKRDGQWLAEHLGVDPALFANTRHAGGTDQLAARAMNQALWPATLGYWMESMMSPVFSPEAVERTRDFFNRYVVAGGACPAIRIGSQPYGILPATAFSRMDWIRQRESPLNVAGHFTEPTQALLRRLYLLLRAMDEDFGDKLDEVSFVGKRGDDEDPHALLLDIVGLHPGSVEWSQRYAESLKTLFNRLNLAGLGGLFDKIFVSIERAAARSKLDALGYDDDEQAPVILDLIFNGEHNQLKGGVVDDVPLSETAPIRAYTENGRNYLQWLIDAARTSLDALYAQQGFKGDHAPSALLYLFLRHALQLGYHDVSIRLHQSAGLYDPAATLKARTDDPFLHVRQNESVSESRYQPLYSSAPAITGSNTQAVHEYIGVHLSSLLFARYLREQLDALERLKNQPTARLERVFADHIDCCAYRLDAWLLALVNYQLNLMRNVHDGSAVPARRGVYLGGYAWLENLEPENKKLEPVRFSDPELEKKFGDATKPPLVRDSTNQGYVHAPSLNHAVAAAVLRNGFISNASPEKRQTLAINLTSTRVRTALGFIEGIRAGQSLSDLLGYQFERGLHDRHDLVEVDKFILKLRRAFPLRADRMLSTRPPEGVSIEAIEARNVINGLALVEHIQTTKKKLYPFDKPNLPPASQLEQDAINAEVERLLEAHDAVADLALSEGVYQAVVGNYDRVASTYDAYARGDFPPEPDVVRTPLNGFGLTHRVVLHLAAGANPNASPTPGLAMTPRAKAEPALNQWLTATLPQLSNVSCRVTFLEAATGLNRTREIMLHQLNLQPADFIALVRDDSQQAMSELDDRVLRHAMTNFGPRPDVPVVIRYMERQLAPISVFEAMPLFRNLRGIVKKSRPLEATDLALMNEAKSQQNSQPFVNKTRLDLVRTDLQTLHTDVTNAQTALAALLANTVANRATLLIGTDTLVTNVATLLSRAATFAVPQSGWGFAYDFRRQSYAAILKQCEELVDRWDAKLVDFSAKLSEAAAADTDQAKFNRLKEAERFVSTQPTQPLPATPAAYLATLTGIKQPAFEAKRDQFAAVADTTRTSLSQLLADVQALLPLTDFDFGEFSFTALEDDMIRFAEDVASLLGVIATEIKRRLDSSAERFKEHDDSAVAAERVKTLDAAARTLLGEDFRIFPEFDLEATLGDELEKALTLSRNGELFKYLTDPPNPKFDFPVDTWLAGVARVRGKMFAWEQVITFATAFGRAEPVLDALQLPFVAGDRWLGLEFPPDQALDKDRLLYTAHFAAPFNKAAPQCGLLIDEWSETIPTSSVDTGIVFHHDRPNNEAPQTMLLVTPSKFRGTWRWVDLVDALHETLDLAKRRAIEPKHLDASPYAPFLPATVVATQARQLTIALELAFNNKIAIAK